MRPTSYSVERLPNGYWRIQSRASKSWGLFNADGSPHCGDLANVLPRYQAAEIIDRSRHLARG